MPSCIDIMSTSKSKLYVKDNIPDTYKYKYARPYKINSDIHETKQMTIDGISYVNVIVTGIPDGIFSDANEALISATVPYRLYIYSTGPLTEDFLMILDDRYGKESYSMCPLSNPIAMSDTQPRVNFYAAIDDEISPPSLNGQFVDYKYFTQRFQSTNKVYDMKTGQMYNMCLPKDEALIVLIMPSNFIQTGLKQGYFIFENDLIVRIYSKYLLSSTIHETDNGLINTISTLDCRLMNAIKVFYSRLGLQSIDVSDLQRIIAYDNFITAVVGSVNNLNFYT